MPRRCDEVDAETLDVVHGVRGRVDLPVTAIARAGVEMPHVQRAAEDAAGAGRELLALRGERGRRRLDERTPRPLGHREGEALRERTGRADLDAATAGDASGAVEREARGDGDRSDRTHLRAGTVQIAARAVEHRLSSTQRWRRNSWPASVRSTAEPT